ncbi:MAG: hypothetical protein U5M51_03435 [Emticicia sp.]|nr:hypothetical protein [Emticicia sp.]
MYNLPEYEPSEEVWNKINSKLHESALQNALEKLPIYEPDDTVWNKIDNKLSPKTIKFSAWRWASVAASIAIVLGFSYWLSTDKQQIRYSEERIDKDLLLNPIDDSQQQYEMIVAYCKQQTYVCENPEFVSLKTELEELNSASKQLQEAVGQYNTEPQLMAQLSSIEQQKSEIIRKMAAKI